MSGRESPPLRDVEVVEFAQLIAGPSAGLLLADYGARVTKIEPPTGDASRQMRSLLTQDTAFAPTFLAYNRNKTVLRADLRTTEGKRLALQKISTADVVIESGRPGAMDRLGLGAEAITASHPEVIYASISGFGWDGPDAARGGVDLVVQAETGIMSITGFPDGPPTKVGFTMVDAAAAHALCHGILAALFRRSRTGRGDIVRVSLYDVAVQMLSSPVMEYLLSGTSPLRCGNSAPLTAPADLLRCQDGHIVVSAYLDQHWERFLEVIDARPLGDDPRFATRAARVRHRAVLTAALEEYLGRHTAGEWLPRLTGAGVVAGVVKDIAMVADDVLGRPDGVIRAVTGSDGHAVLNPVRLLRSAAVEPILPDPDGEAPSPGRPREVTVNLFEDFDHRSTEHRDRWVEDFREMRERCPVAHSARYDGFYVLTRYADVTSVARDNDAFTSVNDRDRGPQYQGVHIPPSYPKRHSLIEMDGTDWQDIRHTLNPFFTRTNLERLVPRITAIADDRLDQFVTKGEIDLVLDYTMAVPAVIALELIGMPEEGANWKEWATPHHEIVFTPPDSPDFARILEQRAALYTRVSAAIAERRLSPRDDMLTTLTQSRFRGEVMPDDLVLEVIMQLLTAGFDTTNALMGNVFVYLSEHPDVRQRLIDEPTLVPTAIEEFLRLFSPAHGSARTVVGHRRIGDQDLSDGDRLYVAWSAANRDPAEFPDPDAAVIDRDPNHHVAFGLGTHRCIGNNLARIEATILLERVLERIPQYQVDIRGAERYASIGLVNGWTKVPSTFPCAPIG